MERGLREMNGHNQMAIWSERVAACRASGMSVSQWCNQEGVNLSSYYRWQRKLFEHVQKAEGVCFAEVPLPPRAPQGVVATLHSGNLRVELHSGADRAFLQGLVEALKSC